MRKLLSCFISTILREDLRYLLGRHLLLLTPNLKKYRKKWLPNTVFLSKDGRLFVANPFRYEILTYKNTLLEKSFRRKSKIYKSAKIVVEEHGDEGYSYSKEEAVRSIFEFDDYLLIILYSKNEIFIDVFDKRDFSFKGSSKIDIKGYPEPTRNDSIYFGDEWKITKYKIIIKEG